MKKISAFFLSIFLMALLSCAPEEDTKTIIITPPELMSAVTCSVQAAEITADDKISLNAPQNATDATLYYEIAVGVDCETPTEGSSEKYTGEITLSRAGLNPSDDNIITLKVLAVKKGFENGTWTFRWRFSDGSMPLVNDDAYLKSVSASNNEANFGFLPNVFVYDDINVPNDIEKISIDYEKSNKDATVETSPASLKDIPLRAGRTTLVTFTVTSSDKTTKKRYSFNIYRASKSDPDIKSTDCFLSSLSVKGDTLIAFDKNKENYKASVANSVDTTSVTYVLSSNKAQVVTNPASLDNISLMPGQTRDVSITVTAEDPSFTKIYTVSIYREPAGQLSSDATLKSLSVTGGNLSFNSATTDYEVTIPADSATVSVMYEENHIGATVTTIPTNLNNISIAPGATETVTVSVTAEDKVSTEVYIVKIKRNSVSLDSDANLSGITLSAGSLSFDKDSTSYTVDVDKSVENVTVTATTESDKAKVTYIPSQTVAPQKGGSETVTINVTAEDGTPKTYTVIVNRAGDDNPPPPPPPAGKYYWTNKDGAVGTNKTISSWADWTVAEQITQNAAYDDPRTWKGIQEVPYDVYALYAAYDDTNLYIMVELTNIVDRASFMFHDYAGSDNAWWDNRDIPLGMLFNTGKGVKANKPTIGGTNKPIWDAIDFSDAQGFDAMFYHSSKYGYAEHNSAFVGVGTPGFFTITSAGVFSYGDANCKDFAGAKADGSGVHVRYKRQCAVSKTIYYESTPTGNRGESGQTGETLISSTTYKSVSTNDLDMSYWYTIPLSALGIDKNHIQTKGIGIRQLTTGGGSLMDCSPWDVSMVDSATEPYSKVADNTSHEKEDVDDITSAQARIGKM